MPECGLVSQEDNAAASAERPDAIWFVHGGGLPLAAIGECLSGLLVFGAPKAYFDHDRVMFEETRRLNVARFRDYADALFARREGPFAAFVTHTDLPWLSEEPAMAGRFGPVARFVRLHYRDPALQAVRLMAERTSKPPPLEIDDARFISLADLLIELEEEESATAAWLAERSLEAVDLAVEDLTAPGLAVLRHLLDGWSLTLPEAADIRPIEAPDAGLQATAAAFRAEAERRQWGQAVQRRAPHWHRRMTRDPRGPDRGNAKTGS